MYAAVFEELCQRSASFSPTTEATPWLIVFISECTPHKEMPEGVADCLDIA
jgi:hypothetical protein